MKCELRSAMYMIQARKRVLLQQMLISTYVDQSFLHITKHSLPLLTSAPGKFPIAVNSGSAATCFAMCLILAAQYEATQMH